MTEYAAPTLLNRVITWGPLGLATIIAAVCGFTAVGAGATHGFDMAEQQQIGADRAAEAEFAEAELVKGFDVVLDRSTEAESSRLKTDASTLERAFAAGIPSLGDAALVPDGEPVLTKIDGEKYTWFAVGSTADDKAAVVITTLDGTGTLTNTESHWAALTPTLTPATETSPAP